MSFGRIVTVVVGEPGTQGRRISSLRPDGGPGISIDFSIDHARRRQPSRAKLQLHNVSDDTAAAFDSSTAYVRVELGYVDDGSAVAFQGNPVPGGVEFRKQGPDRTLHVELQDGGRRYRIGRVEFSSGEQISAREAFDEIVAQTGYPVGRVELTSALPLVRGVVWSGPARAALDDLAGHTDREWFVRDGRLNMVDRRKDTGETAILFSSETGNLIGSPSAIDIDGVRGIEVKGLMSAGVRQGHPFKVESRQYNGFFVAKEVSFRGSSYEGDFSVVVRGTPRR